MTPSLQIGNGKWAVKSGNELGYKIINNKYYPREMTVTRATTGTRVNADGLVELVPYNLLTWSEEFSNAAWTKIRASILSNATTAPDGTLTANKLIEDTTASNTHILVGGAVLINTIYTMGVYAKAAERTQIGLFNSSSSDVAYFDLSNGTIISSGTHIASIESVGNGWYRCNITSTTLTAIRVGVANGGAINYTGDGTSGVYIWGTQLVEGTEAKDYLPTTTRLNIPRVDYSTGEAALLIEPQRTNLLTYSEQFDNAAWVKTALTLSVNSATSPSGVLNADKITQDTSNTIHDVVSSNTSITSGLVYSVSCFCKAGEADLVQLTLGGSASHAYANYNLTTGQVVGSGNSPVSSSIKLISDGWYLCTIVCTSLITTGSGNAVIGIANSPSMGRRTGFIGNGTDGLYLWGAQLELGDYPTSYIPTTSASVTRNADVITKTDASAYIGQTEGTIFIEFDNLLQTSYGNEYLVSLYGDSSNAIWIRKESGSNTYTARVLASGSTAVTMSQLNFVDGLNKVAFTYKSGDSAVYLNGYKIATDLDSFTFAVPLTQLGVCNTNGSLIGYEKIKSVSIYKERLTDDELQTLTGGVFTTYAMMAQNLNYILQ